MFTYSSFREERGRREREREREKCFFFEHSPSSKEILILFCVVDFLIGSIISYSRRVSTTFVDVKHKEERDENFLGFCYCVENRVIIIGEM